MSGEILSARGNLYLAKVAERRFPGLLVQGDTLRTLLDDLEEDAPDAPATATIRDWVRAYEEMMGEQGLPVPY